MERPTSKLNFYFTWFTCLFFGTNSLGTARIKFSAHIICNINTKDLTVITDKINQFNKFKWNNKFLAKLTLIHQIVRVNYIRYLVLLHYTLNFYIGKNMCNIILQLLQYNWLHLTLNVGFVYYVGAVTGNKRSHGVMVSTLDFESSDPSSNLGGTYILFLVRIFFIKSQYKKDLMLCMLLIFNLNITTKLI